MDGGAEQLHFHFLLSCIGEGNGNPLQCSCLENPRDGEAWWAAISGVTQSRTGLKRRSSSKSDQTSCLFQHIPSKHMLSFLFFLLRDHPMSFWLLRSTPPQFSPLLHSLSKFLSALKTHLGPTSNKTSLSIPLVSHTACTQREKQEKGEEKERTKPKKW